MRHLRSERGGAYLYVIVCVSVMGFLLVNIVPYVTQARTIQARRARQARADLATEALMQQTIAEASAAPISANGTRTLSLNGATVNASITDGSGTVPNSYCLTGTTTLDGQSYGFKRYITQGAGASPYSFALYSNTDMRWGGKIITGAGGADGDVFCNANIDLSAVSGTTVNGNLSAKGSVNLPGGSVTGSTIPGTVAVAMPSVTALNYQTNASSMLYGSQAFAGGASFGPMVNGHYPITYIMGDLTSFGGTIYGMGVVFVQGNVNVSGNLSYADSNSRVALVATGNITIAAGCQQGIGILYCGGTLTVNSPDFNIARGLIVAKTIASGPIIRVTRDNFMQTSSAEGTKLCLPGYWP